MQPVWDPACLHFDGPGNQEGTETSGVGVPHLLRALEDYRESEIGMADLWDAVEWKNLQDKTGAKAGYIDGSVSTWPEEAWFTFQSDPLLHITVLANPEGEAFDGETGNAGPEQVAAAILERIQSHKWAILYTNQEQQQTYLQALRGKGVNPSGRESWPAPGVYLWCADPSGNIAAGHWQPPVAPVAVQDQWNQGWDHSTLYVDLKETAPAPPQPAPAEEVCQVQLPVLKEGITAEAVRSLQKLLGGLATDGIFGPQTHQAVVTFQAGHQLAQDGIVGQHTWGALLGAPQ